MPEPIEKKKRRARRNFAKELERVEIYIETVLRIYAQEEESAADPAGGFRKGQCRAYGDILALIQGGAK